VLKPRKGHMAAGSLFQVKEALISGVPYYKEKNEETSHNIIL